VKDFHSKVYPRKKFKTELKEEHCNKTDGETTNDSNDDIVEIFMQIDPILP